MAGRWWQEAILHFLLSLPVSEKMEAGAPASLGPVRDSHDEPNTAPEPQEGVCVWPLAASLTRGIGRAATTTHSGVVGEEPERDAG